MLIFLIFYLFLIVNVGIIIATSYQNYIGFFPFYVLFLLFHILAFLILGLDLYIFTKPKKEIKKTKLEKLELKAYPKVSVLIPTVNEPVNILNKTITAVVQQNYPHQALEVIVSDDGYRLEIRPLIRWLQQTYPQRIVLNYPPPKQAAARKGNAKDGNLNSALTKVAPDTKYIETRDADDYVEDKNFLLNLVKLLEHDPQLAFVQTSKTVSQSDSEDKFGNAENFFYKVILPSRSAVNASFPCGSGLVWRKAALQHIGGFPTWNLVEDYTSGVLAHRLGWKSIYMAEIEGAISEVPPLDLPNFIKQRGTWALDSLRYLLYGNFSGLNFEQKVSYALVGLFYLLSAVSLFFSLLPPLAIIFDFHLISLDNKYETLIYANFVLLTYFHPFLMSTKYNKQVKSSQILKNVRVFYGLGPTFFQALLKALVYGASRKPRYKVTRKNKKAGVHLRMVAPQLLLLLLYLFAAVLLVLNPQQLTNQQFNIVWMLFYAFMYSKIVSLAWN